MIGISRQLGKGGDNTDGQCWVVPPLTCSRHHLSYDYYPEDKREIVRTVLCRVVYYSCAQ